MHMTRSAMVKLVQTNDTFGAIVSGNADASFLYLPVLQVHKIYEELALFTINVLYTPS